jgi:polyisoprenoid-binding protein YceI
MAGDATGRRWRQVKLPIPVDRVDTNDAKRDAHLKHDDKTLHIEGTLAMAG